MGGRSRLGFAAAVAVTLAGCAGPRDDDDRGDRRPPHGAQTIEKTVASATLKYELAQAKICDKIADDLEGGKVLDMEKLEKRCAKESGEAYDRDYKPVTSMIAAVGKKERGKMGKRQVKMWRAMAEGYRMAADAAKSEDDDRDEPERPVKPHRRDRDDDGQSQDQDR
jgi:hypothetical protein